jgi:hypothetical protein
VLLLSLSLLLLPLLLLPLLLLQVPDPLPDQDRGFVPALGKGTLAGKKTPPGFPTLKTMSVSSYVLHEGDVCLCVCLFVVTARGCLWSARS